MYTPTFDYHNQSNKCVRERLYHRVQAHSSNVMGTGWILEALDMISRLASKLPISLLTSKLVSLIVHCTQLNVLL
jgi:hypothetical protein